MFCPSTFENAPGRSFSGCFRGCRFSACHPLAVNGTRFPNRQSLFLHAMCPLKGPRRHHRDPRHRGLASVCVCIKYIYRPSTYEFAPGRPFSQKIYFAPRRERIGRGFTATYMPTNVIAHVIFSFVHTSKVLQHKLALIRRQEGTAKDFRTLFREITFYLG